MPKRSNVDPQEVAALKESGWTVDEIAGELGISRRWVYVNLSKAGWFPPEEPESKDPGERTLRTLYVHRKFTSLKLAGIFKVNQRTVTRWLTKHNINRRTDDEE